MEGHLGRKHDIQKLAVRDPDTLKLLIGQCAIREDDAKILYMIHFQGHDQDYVADILGMSVQNVRKRYYKCLENLHALARLREVLR